MIDESVNKELAEIAVTVRDGRRVTLRAVHPDDRDACQAAFDRLCAEARYTRFFAPQKELPREMLEHTVHPVPGRELVLVANRRDESGETIVGGARYVADRAHQACEFAITLSDDWHGVGLASRLMRELIAAARANGLARMEGFVLADNRPMLRLARRLGFESAASSEGPAVRLVWLDLNFTEKYS